MDPLAALTAAAEAIKYGERAEARVFLDSYREWRKHGGFEPSFVDSEGMQFGDLFAARLRLRLDDKGGK